MRRATLALAGALFWSPAARAVDDPPQAPAPADGPKAQVDALLKQYHDTQQEFFKVYQEAKSDEERQKLFETKYPKPAEYAAKLIEIARAHPKSPAAFEAWAWIAQNAGQGAEVKDAVAALARDHADDPRIVDAISGPIATPYVEGGDVLLQAVLATNPDPAAKGRACFGLAEYAKACAELIGTIDSDPAMEARLVPIYGRDRLVAVQAKGRAGWEKEAEGHYRRVIAEFPEGKHFRGTLGQAAESALFEMNNLAIGKPAPEIVGEDLDGRPMKLSDYRGKVVVLDFWGDW